MNTIDTPLYIVHVLIRNLTSRSTIEKKDYEFTNLARATAKYHALAALYNKFNHNTDGKTKSVDIELEQLNGKLKASTTMY